MAKNIRYSRTNIDGSLPTTAPSQHTQVVPHAVPEFPKATGLEGLSDTFSRFFGQAIQGLDSIREGAMIGQKMRITQENEAQKVKAASDFYEGKSADQSLLTDSDYYDTYRSLLAARNGDEAATEFAKFYRETWLPANPTGDLADAREGWIKKNLTGADDKEYEAQVLAQFVKSTDPLIGQQSETAVKTIVANGNPMGEVAP